MAAATRGLIVAAAASHSGKTTFSIGLIAALRVRGLLVAAAKCGPDYIDPKFLEAASGAPAINLDRRLALSPGWLSEQARQNSDTCERSARSGNALERECGNRAETLEPKSDADTQNVQ